MKGKVTLLMGALFLPVFCGSTYVLQNGLNGYAGCRDAMIDEVAPAGGGRDSVLRTSCG